MDDYFLEHHSHWWERAMKTAKSKGFLPGRLNAGLGIGSGRERKIDQMFKGGF